MLPRWLLGAVYLLFLLYLFAGVAIASDMFMDGIMNICAITKIYKRKNEKGETIYVKEPVWNWVVANITLMALGTSSPEIMLSLVEALLTLGKPAGELGPSCIAGSAAYNFLMISAVCTTALPDGQFKKISQLRVYVVTAAWSIWAYIWMLIVYVYWTPNEVTLAEAFLTLGFFVLMVLTAWIVDKQPWKKNNKGGRQSSEIISRSDPEAPAALPPPSVTAIVVSPAPEQAPGEAPVRTHAHYRHILAARQRHAAAAHRRLPGAHGEGGDTELQLGSGGHAYGDVVVPADPTKEQVMFRSRAYAFLESAGTARVAVTRVAPEGGSLDHPLRVHYRTEDGDAVAGLDYEAREGTLHFAPGEAYKYVEVRIIDDDMTEPDVHFSIVLTGADAPNGAGREVLVAQERVRVTIVDDDDAGVIGFELPDYEVAFNEKRTFAEVTLVRRRGADGRVTVDYETQDLSAVAGDDYVAAKGTVVFESGEKSARVRLQLLQSFVPEAHKALQLVLSNPEGGAELGKRSACKVTLVRRQFTLMPGAATAAGQKEGLELGNGSIKLVGGAEGGAGSDKGEGEGEEFNLWSAWREQIVSVFSPDEPDEGEVVSWAGLMLQYINITWKLVLFILVPPAEWKGGYPCFFAALGSIVGIVYLVNEAGSLFGCIIGLKEVMVGVSIVAVGTSLPDTLASRIAAVKDPDADAAIGNITGSNGVNVFLGLGLPWAVCSVYYHVRGEKYVTPGGDLEFAVMLYAILGGCGIFILAVARYFGGELGGTKLRQYSIAGLLTVLWLLYLILSGLRAYGNI
ncbi:hypothetical protein CHLRE_11g479600v5 [Chlamydomonas reinhardtii]|uniref:Calx-beta domain-containing protein n=1 Tax=Chlamydomonas reinhardtii TaxID=3055 RepID=A0A2K3D8M1_CHLRE|nr:uncharacterized protein CHLRE_11g479600v5 [Chlamydomonas reinhardtii]PNW76872.1 hypothetical protein CHLRE_11g479600v5 [Chlamydomonas reinhardtii]